MTWNSFLIFVIVSVCKCTVTHKQLFHQAILMGGSDLCEWSIVDTIWNANALTYARDLGRLVGCGFDYDQSNEYLVDCLLKKHYDEIVNATASIPQRVCVVSFHVFAHVILRRRCIGWSWHRYAAV